MERFNKFHMSLVTLFLSTTVVSSASAIAPSQQVRQHGGWYVEVEPFYAKAKDTLLSTLPFAETSVETFFEDDIELEREDSILHTFRPGRKWGFRVAAGYDFPSCNCCTYGFSLEYTYLKIDDNQRLTNFVDEDFEPALDDHYGFFDADATDANVNLEYKYHAVDLLGHKNLSVCGCVDLQLFSGARYVHLKEELNRHLFVNADLFDDVISEDNTASDFFSNYNAKFDGLGPRVGVNAFYPVACGVGIVTEVAGDLLFGVSRSDYSERLRDVFDEGETVFEGRFHEHNKSDAHVVPGLSGKVGLAYRTVFCNCSSVSVELGYRGDKYFGIGYHSALVNPVDFDAGFVKDGSFHDFDISGPYLNLTYRM